MNGDFSRNKKKILVLVFSALVLGSIGIAFYAFLNENKTGNEIQESRTKTTSTTAKPVAPANPVAPATIKQDIYLILRGSKGGRNFYEMSSDGSDIKLLPPIKNFRPDFVIYRNSNKTGYAHVGNDIYKIQFPSLEYTKVNEFKPEAKYLWISLYWNSMLYEDGDKHFLVGNCFEERK